MAYTNSINEAIKYSEIAVVSTVENMVTAPFLTDETEFTGAKTFHKTGYVFTSPTAKTQEGFAAATALNQTDQAYTLATDVEDNFLLDIKQMDESGSLNAEAVVSEYMKQSIAPAMDINFFSQVSLYVNDTGSAINSDFAGLASSVINYTLASFTADNVYSRLQEVTRQGTLRVAASQGGVIVFVSSTIMDLLERSTEISAGIQPMELVDGGTITTRVAKINGMSIVEVTDNAKLVDVNSKPIHMMACAKNIVFTVLKLAEVLVRPNGTHTRGFGDFVAMRNHYDTFVEGNPATGLYDGAAYSADLT